MVNVQFQLPSEARVGALETRAEGVYKEMFKKQALMTVLNHIASGASGEGLDLIHKHVSTLTKEINSMVNDFIPARAFIPTERKAELRMGALEELRIEITERQIGVKNELHNKMARLDELKGLEND
jgi:hypothetical protein